MTAPDELPGMLQVAINVQKQVWPHTMDAREWATRFVEQYAKTPAIAADESTMLSWFANAIMAGYDTASIRAPDSAPNGLTDAEIVAIRDDHLPSQGEAFDCIAFARAIERRVRNQPGGAVPREPTKEMVQAAVVKGGLHGEGSFYSRIWIAMHDAATKAGEGETPATDERERG